MKLAGSMLIMKNGFILGVSRKNDRFSFGLPAGKAEAEETSKQAAIRETYEETGIVVRYCIPFFKREEDGFEAHCFFAREWTKDLNWKRSSSEKGSVEWITPSMLTNKDAAFPEYNRRALIALLETLIHRDKGFDIGEANLLSLAQSLQK